MPYLVSAQRLTPGAAGALITVFVLASIAFGPPMAAFAARHPLWRSWLVLSVIALQVTVWTVVLGQPGPAPTWLLVVLVLTLATGGPGSMVGIDIGRTSNPVENAGLAQSLVNMGGFLATLLVLLSVGLLLSMGGGFTPEAFRMAWTVQYLVWFGAVTALVLVRRKSRRLDAERGVAPRPFRQVLAMSVGR
jgi:hypothetical protein